MEIESVLTNINYHSKYQFYRVCKHIIIHLKNYNSTNIDIEKDNKFHHQISSSPSKFINRIQLNQRLYRCTCGENIGKYIQYGIQHNKN